MGPVAAEFDSPVIDWMLNPGNVFQRLSTKWKHSRDSLRRYHQDNAVAILQPEKPCTDSTREHPFEISKARKL